MPKPFVLPAELNIYTAVETRDALLARSSKLTAGASIEVSAAKVSEIDGAGLQLLASLSNMEHPWRLVETSACFSGACKAMGFGHWLETAT